MAGRGSFIESFPLFGYDLNDYDELFAEKLDLLLTLRKQKTVTWKGRHRKPIEKRSVFPQPVQSPLPLWIAVGGTPRSAHRAGSLGLPLALGIIGGQPEQFKPLSDLHRKGAREAGHQKPALSINSHGFIADNSQDAADIAFPAFAHTMDKIGKERGWPSMTRQQFESSRALRGANVVGSPAEVIDKILFQHEIFGHDRFLIQMSVGSIPHKKLIRSIELFATEVAPAVRRATAGKKS
ncbi:MAG: LLM class flavin-dependent oxidoreductase [Balneolaceae bacterium]